MIVCEKPPVRQGMEAKQSAGGGCQLAEPRGLGAPIRDEDVRLACFLSISIRRPEYLFAIGTKHREAVEFAVRRNLLEAGPVGIDQEKIEVSRARILVVGCEDDSATIDGPGWSEVGAPEVCDLALVTAIGVHDEELDFARTNEAVFEKGIVLRKFRGIGRVVRSIDDFRAVRRPPRSTVVSRRTREAFDVRPIDVHDVDVEVPIFERREDDAFAVWRYHGFRCVRIVIR